MPACRNDHRVGLVGLGYVYAALAARWSHGPCRSPPSKPGLSDRASGASLAPQLCAATPLRARGCGSGRCAVRSRAHLLERDLDLRRVRRGRHERSEGARLVRPALRSAQRGAERPAMRQGHRAPNPTRNTDSAGAGCMGWNRGRGAAALWLSQQTCRLWRPRLRRLRRPTRGWLARLADRCMGQHPTPSRALTAAPSSVAAPVHHMLACATLGARRARALSSARSREVYMSPLRRPKSGATRSRCPQGSASLRACHQPARPRPPASRRRAAAP